ncbi:MAG: hypothetical protein RSC38_05260, partial [Oscillospiraceae bacterium]
EWATYTEQAQHATTLPSKNEYKGNAIAQTTLDGKVIAVWQNSNIAATVLHSSQMMISACCQGTANSAYGYLWRFADCDLNQILENERIKAIKEKIKQLSDELTTLET